MKRKFNSQLTGQAGFIGLLVGVIVAIGAIAITYVLIAKNHTNFTSITKQSLPGSTAKEGNLVFDSLGKALKSTQSLKCDTSMAGFQSTSYVKNGAARTDSINTNVEEGSPTRDMYMIIKDGSLWQWFEGLGVGTRYTYSEEQAGALLQWGAGAYAPNFNCQPYPVDDSFFILPVNVNFLE